MNDITVELNDAEVRLIEQALKTWENDPNTGAAMQCMVVGVMYRNDEVGAEYRTRKIIQSAEVAVLERQRKSTLLRAKLIQAESRASEKVL